MSVKILLSNEKKNTINQKKKKNRGTPFSPSSIHFATHNHNHQSINAFSVEDFAQTIHNSCSVVSNRNLNRLYVKIVMCSNHRILFVIEFSKVSTHAPEISYVRLECQLRLVFFPIQ